MAVNPYTNQFEMLQLPNKEEVEALRSEIFDPAYRQFHFTGLVRPNGEHVPEHWARFQLGEQVVIMNGYTRLSEGRTGDRNGGLKRNFHPTVKAVSLMRWLCRLITPPGGVVLDPFAGSGSTGIAAIREGFGFIGIERDPEYFNIMKARIEKELRQLTLF